MTDVRRALARLNNLVACGKGAVAVLSQADIRPKDAPVGDYWYELERLNVQMKKAMAALDCCENAVNEITTAVIDKDWEIQSIGEKYSATTPGSEGRAALDAEIERISLQIEYLDILNKEAKAARDKAGKACVAIRKATRAIDGE